MYTILILYNPPPPPTHTHTQSTKAVYNHIIDLKIATPQIIINYGLFLEEQNCFEEAFKVRSILVLLLMVGFPYNYVHACSCMERLLTHLFTLFETLCSDIPYRIVGNFRGVKNSFIWKTVIFVSINFV